MNMDDAYECAERVALVFPSPSDPDWLGYVEAELRQEAWVMGFSEAWVQRKLAEEVARVANG